MTKLTKTEAKILAELNARGRYCCEMYGGQGAQGGRVSGGHREYDAGSSLVKKGLAVLVSQDSHIVYQRGYGVHIYTALIRKSDTKAQAEATYLAQVEAWAAQAEG